jgi:hypothetical protein
LVVEEVVLQNMALLLRVQVGREAQVEAVLALVLLVLLVVQINQPNR